MIPVRRTLLAVPPMLIATTAAWAESCPANHDQLQQALRASVKPSGGPTNGGFDNNEWAAITDRNGVLCAIAFSGAKPADQWLGSRAIAAEKANTANALSLDNYAMSTANLYSGAQPNGFLFGLQMTNPPTGPALLAGDPSTFGSGSDPLLGKPVGGVVVFGGGLALYSQGHVVGGLGASGDTSCADHNIAWRIRAALKLDQVPAGPTPQKDGIIYDIQPDKTSASGFGHPSCVGKEPEIAEQLKAGSTPGWAKPRQ
ncbi:hypothetical protein SLNSH_23120 [Alsobacter soli]|uniref:Heme-binding protein n=1 Tax=Alsobacter soli TaxID=2109933 RepID=A0A2T1HLV1_9HYPH|nr:hypothetical protein SLNSH_23120 [Alsobacter soli]